MREITYWLRSNESGQGMLEYGLILMIVSLAFILLLGALGSGTAGTFNSIRNQLP